MAEPAKKIVPLPVAEQHALIERTLGLVHSLAQRYYHAGLSMEDMIQEGRVGLVVAAQRFDVERGIQFTTYAGYWVRAFIMEYTLRMRGPVRLGTTAEQRRVFFGLNRARLKIEGDGDVADVSAIAAMLGVKEETVESVIPRMTGHDVALDAFGSANDERGMHERLAAVAPSPEEMAGEAEIANERQRRLDAAIDEMNGRDRFVVKMRLLRDPPHTLQWIAARLDLSRERVRQLEVRVRERLRRRLTK